MQPFLKMSRLMTGKHRVSFRRNKLRAVLKIIYSIQTYLQTKTFICISYFFICNVPLDHWASFIVLSKKGLLLHSSFVKAQAQ